MAIDKTLGVALSGGGHRASIFGLGALLYLVDAERHSRLTAVSSVSGGSITNAFIGQHCDLATVTQAEFDVVAAKFVRTIMNRGVLEHWVTVLYLGLMVAFAVLIAATWIWSFPIAIPTTYSILAVVLLGVALIFRGVVVDYVFGMLFFAADGRQSTLEDLDRTAGHIFCATNITDGAPLYFLGWKTGYIYSHTLGLAKAGKTRLRTAVRASAALPGAFPPKRLHTGRYRFTRHQIPVEDLPESVYLADGGVWNNLGDQWFDEVNEVWEVSLEMSMKGPSLEDRSKWPGIRVDEVLVVDASAPLKETSNRLFAIPFLGEIASLSRSLGLVYFNSVQPRVSSINTKLLHSRMIVGSQFGDRAVASMTESPGYFAAEFIPRSTSLLHEVTDDTERRAHQLMQYLDELTENIYIPESHLEGSEVLRDLSDFCAQTPTTLSRFDAETTLALLVNGYLAAMEVCHVVFDYPLVPLALERFHRLLPEHRAIRGPRAWLFESNAV